MAKFRKFEDIFTGDEEAISERKEYLVHQALKAHLHTLGVEKHADIDYIKGVARLSVVNYFANAPQFNNPVNAAALSLVPTIWYENGYGNSTMVHSANDGYTNITSTSHLSMEEAIRQGKSAQWIVAQKLNLKRHFVNISLPSYNSEGWLIEDTARDIARGFADNATADLSVHAQRTQERNHADFLDYLVDVRMQMEGITDKIFEYGYQKQPEELIG